MLNAAASAPPAVLAGRTEPGSNRQHHLSRADWRFLLPPVSGARVLCLGVPHPGELSGLCSAALVVVAADAAQHRLRELQRHTAKLGLDNVAFVYVAASTALPLRAGTFDVVVLPGKLGMRSMMMPCQTHRDVHRVAARGASVCAATAMRGGARLLRHWLKRCIGSQHHVRTLWTVWRKGSMRAALPLSSAAGPGRYLFSNVLYGRTPTGRLLVTAAVALSRVRMLHRLLPDRAVVATLAPEPVPAFSHVVSVARRHGLDLDGHAIALLASGNFDSNKNAFFVFPPRAAQPDLLVKVTRTKAFNYRLAAEHDALRLLHEGGFVPPGTYPEALFLDRFGDLAMLGQKVVDGVPFRRATTARADCPAAGNCIDWITWLGETSASHDVRNRSALADRCEGLLARVATTFRLSGDEHAFLAARFTTFAATTRDLPLVFRHADAGTWNVLVTPDGEAAFLDWEVSERFGPPLWDLLDFMQSYSSWMARVRGENDPVAGYQPMFEDAGAVLDRQLAAVKRYCAATGLARADVEPLFYACWLDRADRQSAWTTGPLADASYLRLLRACIAQRSSPGLRRLFDPPVMLS